MNKILTIVLVFCSCLVFGQGGSPNLRNQELFSKYEETGITARDETGKNSGTYIGSPSQVNGKVGKCRTFTEVTSKYIDYGDIGDLGNEYSVAAWINTNDITGSELIVGYRTDNQLNQNNIAIQLDINNGDARFLVRDNSLNLGNATASSVISAGTWYLIIGVRSGNNLTLYVDGESAATDSQTFGTIIMNRLIVSNFWNDAGNSIGNSPFNGEIDEVMIFPRAIKSIEVRQLFYGSSSGLLYVYENFKNGKITFHEYLNYLKYKS